MSVGHTHRTKQQGYLLIMLCLMVAALIFGVIRALDSTTLRQRDAARTVQALREAKEAVIAATLLGTQPGQLPCQENTGWIGTVSEGTQLGNCSNTIAGLGRLPWRSLKLQQVPDASGEELWYAISPGFQTAPINNSTIGQLTLNGIPVAAIIFAPGPPLSAQGQNRPIPTATTAPSPSNYLDGTNGSGNGNLIFSTSGGGTNDIAIGITAAELIVPLEKRVLAEIANGIRAYYTANGSMPAAPLGTSLPPYMSNITSAWLSANNWYNLVQYSSANAQSATLSIDAQTLVVQ